MQSYEKKFVNERGNEIVVRVEAKPTHGVKGVSIFIAGPNSDTENHVTLEEAKVIYEGLSQVINDLK